jgi:hypothetical protein
VDPEEHVLTLLNTSSTARRSLVVTVFGCGATGADGEALAAGSWRGADGGGGRWGSIL